MVSLLSQQNDRYEEELRIQDTQERLFIGHRIGIEEELAILFGEEDAIVKRMERYAIDLLKIQEAKAELEGFVKGQKSEEQRVHTGLYNLKAAKQHIGILEHRLGVALDHTNHFIDGGAQAKARLHEMRRLRALADVKLARTEMATARAELVLRQQFQCLAAANEQLDAVRFEVRKAQERILAEKLEFDGTVAEFRRQFLHSQERSNRRNAKPAAARLQAQQSRTDNPLHTIGEITLEQEVAMTRRLRNLEHESELIAGEARQLQRSTMRARHLLGEIQREFDVPVDMSLAPTPAQVPAKASSPRMLHSSGGAIQPFVLMPSHQRDLATADPSSWPARQSGIASTAGAASAATAAASSVSNSPRVKLPKTISLPTKPQELSRPPTLALHALVFPGDARREPDAAPKWASARTSILGGQQERSAMIAEFIVTSFNQAEDSHVALSKQIALKELEVQAAEQELAEERLQTARFAPGNEFDTRRQAHGKAEKRRAALERERLSLAVQTKTIDDILRRSSRMLESMGRALSLDMSVLVSPLEKLHVVYDCLGKLGHVYELDAQSRVATSRERRCSEGMPARGRFSSLTVSIDTSGIDPLAVPSATNHSRIRMMAEGPGFDQASQPFITKNLRPIGTTGVEATGSVLLAEGARTGARKIVLRPNTLRPARVAARMAEPSWQTGVRPLSRAELERESVRALLPQRGVSRPSSNSHISHSHE